MKNLTIELTDGEQERLSQLAALAGFTTQTLTVRLFDHVDQAITRPGSWERDWLAQIVGPGPLAAYDEQFGS